VRPNHQSSQIGSIENFDFPCTGMFGMYYNKGSGWCGWIMGSAETSRGHRRCVTHHNRLQLASIWPGMRLIPLLLVSVCMCAQTGENVLLVVNKNVSVSRQIAEYYRPRRSVPLKKVCAIDTTGEQEIPWKVYEEQI